MNKTDLVRKNVKILKIGRTTYKNYSKDYYEQNGFSKKKILKIVRTTYKDYLK